MRDEAQGPDLAAISERYRLVLSDIWGCVHDGKDIFPAAAALLQAWRAQGRIVILISNAPRPGAVVQKQLDTLGLQRSAYDAIVTSGDTGIAALLGQGISTVGLIGTEGDREALRGTGLELLAGPDGDHVVCTGLPDRDGTADQSDEVLAAMRARDATFHCFNPDRVVVHGADLRACAGAIADRYEAMGGRVIWYGKPHAPIYGHCLTRASELAGEAIGAGETVAVGDSLATDFAGAAAAGFDFIFVTHGIEAAEIDAIGARAHIARFAKERGLTLPEPVALVRELG